jgi:hypothetical protein
MLGDAALAASQTLLDNEAHYLTGLIPATTGGAPTALAALTSEYENAQILVATETQRNPTVDPTNINAAIIAAGNALGGGLPAVNVNSATSSQGLMLGKVLVPWSVVLAVLLFAAGIWYVSRKKSRGTA